MASPSQVQISQAALDELLRDPNGPVADILRHAGDEVAAFAVASAPVSRRGSRYSPPGTLKLRTRRSFDVHVDSDGELAVFVGSPLYPHSFVDSESGFTRNRGGRSVRAAHDRYLEDSLNITVVWP